ncbi:hypothetical protein LDB30_09900 [Acidithiobacillus ferrooxidans]|nr:hypothetical protein LDB30_09900 [Acidithiobacillus ferrooxidans]
MVPPEHGLAFLAPLPVSKLLGVGPATVKKLSLMGIHMVLACLSGCLPRLLPVGCWASVPMCVNNG